MVIDKQTVKIKTALASPIHLCSLTGCVGVSSVLLGLVLQIGPALSGGKQELGQSLFAAKYFHMSAFRLTSGNAGH